MPDIREVIRRICLHLPETEEVISHGSPEYKVRGRSFATLTINHHGDERVALLLNSSVEQQQYYVDAAPSVFFVPPYVGPKGWYGIDLAAGMRWDRVAELACEAYASIAPATLVEQAMPLTEVPEPDTVDVRDLDPLFNPDNQALLAKLRGMCLALPETSEARAFGSPVFKAGKKTFCEFNVKEGIPFALFRVGAERQNSLTLDERFDIPPYMGQNGWIRLRIDARFDNEEIEALMLESYRHFALKRMLKALEEADNERNRGRPR